MELIELQRYNELKTIFGSTSKINFYNTHVTTEKFSNLISLAQRVVSAFGSTHGCESFFSKMKYAKNSPRASLRDSNLENQLRCATSNMDINLEKLSERKEEQISH